MDYYFTTHRSELDHELSAMLDCLVYSCTICGKVDMHGLPVLELAGENPAKFIMTSVLCRECQKTSLVTPK